jgi:transcription elongation factor GreA
VGFGSQVTLLDVARDAEVQYKLVHSEEADVARGLISTTSPIGRGLMGRRVGDTVDIQTPAGPREFEIVGLTTIHDEVF